MSRNGTTLAVDRANIFNNNRSGILVSAGTAPRAKVANSTVGNNAIGVSLSQRWVEAMKSTFNDNSNRRLSLLVAGDPSRKERAPKAAWIASEVFRPH